VKIEYIEGQQALENFEKLATVILQAPVEKQKRPKKAASKEKPQKSDKD